MAYQVLARKWRPRDFDSMVGQDHVLRALVNALDNERLHHAYLFSGTRGVGKTTVARIFAKCLNCESGVSSQPCGECGACRAIDEGRFVDLIEVDAASRTGVDDTRELLENVQYTPSQGRFKVYLIDEVHMFSNHSFNALLKTLEEPPAHVKFLLATTDPQKLPVTILSRCLQFNLKRLSAELIREHLAVVLDREGIEFDAPALSLLARGADGSMRDGLSLLDQAIAFGAGRVVEEDVRSMLGSIAQDHLFGLVEDLAAGDAAGLLARVAEVAEMGPDFGAWLAELLTLLQRLALVQQVPNAIDDSLGDPERVRAVAARMGAEDIQLFYQIGLLGRRDLPHAPDQRGGFEMILLRMLAFRPDDGAALPTSDGAMGGGTLVGGASPPTSAGAIGVADGGPQAAGDPLAAVPGPVPVPVPSDLGRDAQARASSPLDGARAMLDRPASSSAIPATPAVTAAPATSPPPDAPGTAGFPPEPPPDLPPEPPPLGALPDEPGLQGPAAEEMPAQEMPAEEMPAEVMPAEVMPAEVMPAEVMKDPLPPVAAPADSGNAAALDWLDLMPKLGLDGWAQELASHCVQSTAVDDEALTLSVAHGASHLLNSERSKRIQRAIEATLGRPQLVVFEQAEHNGVSPAMVRERENEQRREAARRCITDDALVQAMQARFGASVEVDSVRPLGP